MNEGGRLRMRGEEEGEGHGRREKREGREGDWQPVEGFGV